MSSCGIVASSWLTERAAIAFVTPSSPQIGGRPTW